MKPYQYSMIGLTLDIIGAFLVSVEAIKLEKLRLFRDRLVKLETYTKSPLIYFVDDEPPMRQQKSVPADRYSGLFMGLHYVAGFMLLMVVNKIGRGVLVGFLIRGLHWTFERPWYIAALIVIAFVGFGIVAGLWMLGELVHMAIQRTFTTTISILDFIDSRTPDGSVGLIGFLLLFLGFLGQMLGSYAGRAH